MPVRPTMLIGRPACCAEASSSSSDASASSGSTAPPSAGGKLHDCGSVTGSFDSSLNGNEPLTIATAVEDCFGESAPHGGTLGGVLLDGAPPYQRRLLLLCGATKAAMQLGTYLPLFTHGSYDPARLGGSCGGPAAEWPLPHRGSVAYEWSLCCGREWLLAAVSSVFFVGCMIGALGGGVVADRFGRRPVIVFGTALNAVSVILSSVAPNVTVYVVLRFVAGATSIAVMLVVFTFCVEWVPDGWRSSLGGSLFTASAIGELALVPLALMLEYCGSSGWRALTVAAGLVCALPVPVLWLTLPESPSWLHAKSRDVEAIKSLRKAASLNAAGSSGERAAAFSAVAEKLENANELHLGVLPDASQALKDGSSVRNSKLLLRALQRCETWAMALLWFTAAQSFYGISLAAKVLSRGMGLHTSAAFSALSEIPSAFLAAWALNQVWLGRRTSTSSFFALGGVCCVAIPVTPEPLVPFVAVLGKFFITSAFDGIYVYASEIFETGIRASAVGFCSFAARVGSVLAPSLIAFLTGGRLMLLFGTLALLSAAACRAALPETLVADRPCGRAPQGSHSSSS